MTTGWIWLYSQALKKEVSQANLKWRSSVLNIPKSINARFHATIIDLEKVIHKAQLIRKIEERAEDSFTADEDEITMIQEDITDLRAQIRELDKESRE